jgi:hypothetical protein
MLERPPDAVDTCRAAAPMDLAGDELRRLRRQVQQQRIALGRLTDAVLALRRGTEALRAENRELRHVLGARSGARVSMSDATPGRLGPTA